MTKARELSQLGDVVTVDAGNVGIGTATPSSTVHVAESEITAYNGLATDGQLGIGSTVFVEQVGGSNTAVSQIVFQPRTGFPYNRIVNSGGSAPYMALTTNNAERMRITSAGNVGIGTESPSSKFDLSESNGPTLSLTRTNAVEGSGTIRSVGNTGVVNSQIVFGGGTNNHLAFETNTAERMRIDASGFLMVARTNPGTATVAAGHVLAPTGYNITNIAGTTSATHTFFQRNGASTVGSITSTSSVVAYNTTSDYRLKENVTPIQGAGDIVKAMRPATYTFKADGSWTDGFIAHELQELHPTAVTGSKDEVDEEGNPVYQGVDYSKLTPILTAALQEALNKIEVLEAQNVAFEARLSALEV
jgi:hypothetical protein